MANQFNSNLAHPVAGIYDHKPDAPEQPQTRVARHGGKIAVHHKQVIVTLRDEAAYTAVAEALLTADTKHMLEMGLTPKGDATRQMNEQNRYDQNKLSISTPVKSMVNYSGLPYFSIERKAPQPLEHLMPLTAENVLDVLDKAGVVDKTAFKPEKAQGQGPAR